MGKYKLVCEQYILLFRFIIYVLYSFTLTFSTFYIGLPPCDTGESFIYLIPGCARELLEDFYIFFKQNFAKPEKIKGGNRGNKNRNIQRLIEAQRLGLLEVYLLGVLRHGNM